MILELSVRFLKEKIEKSPTEPTLLSGLTWYWVGFEASVSRKKRGWVGLWECHWPGYEDMRQELGSISARVLINQSARACDLGKLLI